LINLYRDGQDSNGWHADNEKELGPNPVIASLNLGATRRFDLKHNQSQEKYCIELHAGDLLWMDNQIQNFYKHQIAKTKRVHEPRINLTFRMIQ
jgi:alkylated DNA repair dioxygenase AlkB